MSDNIEVTQSKELISIEQELKGLVEIDKKNWTQFYLLMKRVEDESLFKPRYRSFTQWVKDFSVKYKVHETIIWNRKKAGRVYESYAKIQQDKGIEVRPIQDTNVSVESLVLLDKINRHNESVASDLVEKVLNKTITKKDLREVYKSIRPTDLVKKSSVKSVITDMIDYDDNKESRTVTEKMTANKIVSALTNSDWLGVKRERRYFKSSYENNKYSLFTEFPVFTGISRKSRRMDILVCENMTTKHVWELNLICIEVKISKGDLIGDCKFTEYLEFVDEMYLAIPKDDELIEVAKAYMFVGCGLMTVDEVGTVEVVQKAHKIKALRKHDTLTNIALKLI